MVWHRTALDHARVLCTAMAAMDQRGYLRLRVSVATASATTSYRQVTVRIQGITTQLGRCCMTTDQWRHRSPDDQQATDGLADHLSQHDLCSIQLTEQTRG